MNHKNDNDWYEGLERMDHSAPSTATAKTVFPSIQRVQALSEDSIECLSGAFPLKLEVIDVNYAMLCVQRCSCTGGKDNRLCDLWGQNGCLRLQRLQRSEIKPAKTKIKPFSTRFLLFAPSIGFYKPRTTACDINPFISELTAKNDYSSLNLNKYNPR